MNPPPARPPIDRWGSTEVPAGSRRRIQLEVGESYTGLSVRLPLLVWRAKEPGPTAFISSAVHGDEINGTGTIRELVNHPGFTLARGALILLPVVNIMGFERHSRYMPDRRDLNRSFPGSVKGSITSRLANLVRTEIIARCDYGIDLHTAAVRRTNFPNVRADISVPGCLGLAEAFGCEVILSGKGPEGSLRRCATDAGCPTIVLEAGEVWKVERLYMETALRGIKNCLIHLGMVEGTIQQARKPMHVKTTKWVRAGAGGFLQFHVAPGETVSTGQVIATNTGLLGRDHEQILSPHPGIVIGMTTMPAVSPGDPVVHIAVFKAEDVKQMEMDLHNLDSQSLESRLRSDLATNVHVVNLADMW